MRQGVTDYRIIDGKRQQYTADHSPDRVSLLHKGGIPICNSGCSDSIVERFLRPPGKLPVPVALDALSLTLFKITIHDLSGNVNRYFIDISLSILYLCIYHGFCRIILCIFPAVFGGFPNLQNVQ